MEIRQTGRGVVDGFRTEILSGGDGLEFTRKIN
jgi:hypothetical protein